MVLSELIQFLTDNGYDMKIIPPHPLQGGRSTKVIVSHKLYNAVQEFEVDPVTLQVAAKGEHGLKGREIWVEMLKTVHEEFVRYRDRNLG
jgi:hypothetical protein